MPPLNPDPKPDVLKAEAPKPEVHKPGHKITVMPVHLHDVKVNPDDTINDFNQVRKNQPM